MLFPIILTLFTSSKQEHYLCKFACSKEEFTARYAKNAKFFYPVFFAFSALFAVMLKSANIVQEDTLNDFTNKQCPNCQSHAMSLIYTVERIPVYTVVLLRDVETAVNFPAGDVKLGYCPNCGFISNLAFKEIEEDYSDAYEATQGFSPTFNAFHKQLAQDLIDRYDLHKKHIVEIGCGMGEFLHLLCEMGDNTGTGFDPVYRLERSIVGESERTTYITDYFSQAYAHVKGNFYCCKMTLEHIPDTAEFVTMVRNAVGDDADTAVFFQVPNARYVFGDVAFWDIYYEHCSYFTLGSIARLFRHAGFDIVDLWTDYNDQYLMITARPGDGKNAVLPQENDLSEIKADVQGFQAAAPQKIVEWQQVVRDQVTNGRKTVLWGAGSKSASFLTSCGLTLADIQYVVDINPHKAHTFMAGGGQEIVTPDFLTDYQPDIVIIMNPIYKEEIRQSLQAMNVFPEILTL